jgi:hypothetical protein
MWVLYLSFYIVLVPQASSMEEQTPDINLPIVELQADGAN